MESAVFGGGCFWCTQAIFKRIDGVNTVEAGYAGGSQENPSYELVGSGKTSHAEVVRVSYDPKRIGYAELLEVFWKSHDPTTLDRQGADVGPQYRSIILYSSEEQKQEASASKRRHALNYATIIVTEILPLEEFYPAEDYHQHYFERNQYAGYCSAVIAPKLRKMGLDKTDKMDGADTN